MSNEIELGAVDRRMLRVLVRDMAHDSRFIMDVRLKHPTVQDCRTSFVLRQLKGTTAPPV